MEESYSVVVNKDHEFGFTPEIISQLDVLEVGTNKFHLLKDGKSFHFEILERKFTSKEYRIKVNGSEYELSIRTPLLHLIDAMGFASNGSKSVALIEAPMPGLILEIPVKEGQEIKENDTLVILEAMKMENSITSPRDGIIKEVSVKVGDAVDKKQVLITFE